jgi:hypothetical protein
VNFAGHLVFDSSFEGLQTVISLGCESMSTVSSNNTDSVSGCLSKACALVVSKAANSLYNYCVVSRSEIVRSEVLYHVVQNEKAELLSLLNFTCKGVIQSSLSKRVDDGANHGGRGLE